MKVVFLIGSPDISGGTNVIFQHALYLQRQGVDVMLVTDEPVSPARVAWHPEGAQLRIRTYEELGGEEFDVALATWWVTAYKLCRVNARVYAHFIQSDESRFAAASDQASIYWAKACYSLKLPAIVIAQWLAEFLREKAGRPAHLVRNGIRKDIFRPDGPAIAPRIPGELRVLVEGSLGVFFKNVDRTIELCRQSDADEIWLATPTKGVTEYPGVNRVFSAISQEEMAAVYRSCDVIVKLSYVEGMFGPPLEMFHCGGTAIVYDVSGHDEYIVDGQNALVVRRDDEENVLRSINMLKRETAKLEELKAKALKTAASWPDWNSSSQEFLEAVQKVSLQTSAGRTELVAISDVLRGWFEQHVALQCRLAAIEHEADELRAERVHLSREAELYRIIADSKSFRLMAALRSNRWIKAPFRLVLTCVFRVRSLFTAAPSA